MFENLISKIFKVVIDDDGDTFSFEIFGIGVYANERYLVTYNGSTFKTDSKQLRVLIDHLKEVGLAENLSALESLRNLEYSKLPFSEQFYFSWCKCA